VKRAALALALVASLAAGGCSGGGSGVTPHSGGSGSALQGSLKIQVGGSQARAHERRTKYVSPSASSIQIAVTSEAPVIADISSTSPNCTATEGGRTCSVGVTAPSGSVTFTVTIYDGPKATGNVLGTGTTTTTITGSGFSVGITALGQIAKVALTASPSQTTFYDGLPVTETLTATAQDADGNVITGTFENPITLTSSDPSGAFTVSPATLTASGQTSTLKFSGAPSASTPATVTITPSVSGVSNLTPLSLNLCIPNVTNAQTSALSSSGSPASAPLIFPDTATFTGQAAYPPNNAPAGATITLASSTQNDFCAPPPPGVTVVYYLQAQVNSQGYISFTGSEFNGSITSPTLDGATQDFDLYVEPVGGGYNTPNVSGLTACNGTIDFATAVSEYPVPANVPFTLEFGYSTGSGPKNAKTRGLARNSYARAHAKAHPADCAPPYTSLYSFQGGGDGWRPYGNLTSLNGLLYGTTYLGGDTECSFFSDSSGCGTIYSVTTSGSENVVYTFTNAPDGALPIGGLANVNGTLYGTTEEGGANSFGTAFSYAGDGDNILHSFNASQTDGNQPFATQLLSGGKLYGTTLLGGGADCNGDSNFGCGTVYSMTTGGKLNILHTFTSGADGGQPYGDLVPLGGKFYGTTYTGGGGPCSSNGASGCGTIYSVTPSGTENVVYAFQDGADGSYPISGLTVIGNTLYGTTNSGGGGTGCGGTGCGTIFSITPGGTFKTVYTFQGGEDAGAPQGGMIDVDGTLYGTSVFGGGTGCGGNGCGTIFSITPSGTESVLYAFLGGTDGQGVYGRLLYLNGTLYGDTAYGGTGTACPANGTFTGCGTVFSYTLSAAKTHRHVRRSTGPRTGSMRIDRRAMLPPVLLARPHGR
jgi:uncharacterized repeat protein (TIGR03803 family)